MIKFNYILAFSLLITPFFLLAAETVDTYEVVPAKETSANKALCGSTLGFIGEVAGVSAEATSNELKTACAPVVATFWKSYSIYNNKCGSASAGMKLSDNGTPYVVVTYTSFDFRNVCNDYNSTASASISASIEIGEPSFNCPNESKPLFTRLTDDNGNGVFEFCRDPVECPEGYHAFKVNGECVPITCPDAGVQSDEYLNGSVYNNSAGTYCGDGGQCAYSVQAGANQSGSTGSFAATVVSTGKVCGQTPDDEDFWPGNEDDNCTSSSLDTGSEFISCTSESDGGGDDSGGDDGGGGNDSSETDTDGVDLGGNEVTEDDIPEITPEQDICAAGDASCEVVNLKKKLESESSERKVLDVQLHNESVKSAEASTNKLIQSINTSKNQNSNTLNNLSNSIDGLASALDGAGGGSGAGGGTDDSGSGSGGIGEGACDSEADCSPTIATRNEPLEGLTGFWETQYPDGINGVVDQKINEAKDTQFFGFMESFNPTLNGGSPPDFSMCFNLGAFGNFGCLSFALDPRTFPAIRIFILISAGFLCRQLIFGG